MKIPVCLMTYERPEYFEWSTEKLLKTDLSQMSELVVFDDCSKTPEKIKQLDEFEAKGHKVIRAKKWGGTKYSFIDMLKYCFKEQDNEVFALIQDDLVYNSQWLNKLIEIYPKVPNLGILTCWDRKRYGKADKNNVWVMRNPQGEGENLGKNCRMGGAVWLVTRKLGLSIQ